jgi:hypothetical protein
MFQNGWIRNIPKGRSKSGRRRFVWMKNVDDIL